MVSVLAWCSGRFSAVDLLTLFARQLGGGAARLFFSVMVIGTFAADGFLVAPSTPCSLF